MTPTSLAVVEALAAGHYAFIDAGCAAGGSIDHCTRRFGMSPGLGLDYSDADLARARAAGHDVLWCNLLDPELRLPEGCVSYASMMDFLEHLPCIDAAVAVLRALGRACRDFVFIRHPSFDDRDYLARYGLKFTWTDWSGHPNMMTLDEFRAVFARLGWSDYVVRPHLPYRDSAHATMVPLDAPVDVQRHDEAAHGPKKPLVTFDRVVYGKYDLFVRLDPRVSQSRWAAITNIDGWEARWEW
jgi:hypothetical protein